MFTRKLGIALTLAAIFATSSAQDLDGRLESIASRLDGANALFSSNEGMSMQELSKMAVELESIMGEMREVEREYGAKRAEVEDTFRTESKELSEILGYLTTLRNAPAPDFLLHPDGALGAIHANILVESVLPTFEAKLEYVANSLQFWRAINEKQDRLSASTVLAVDEINRIRTQLVELERSDAPKRVVSDPNVLDALFAVSDNLADFVRGMDGMDLAGAPAPIFNMIDNQGNIPWPAEGDLTRALDGVSVTTQQSLIASPVPGTVRFAAEFLDYGNLVIVEPQSGYLMILAGFDQIVVEEGHIIKAGDIVGFFADNKENDVDGEVTPLVQAPHELYVEIRKNGSPVEVTDFFVSAGSKG